MCVAVSLDAGAMCRSRGDAGRVVHTGVEGGGGEGKQRPEGLLAASLAHSYTCLRLGHIRQLVYSSVPIQTEKTHTVARAR